MVNPAGFGKLIRYPAQPILCVTLSGTEHRDYTLCITPNTTFSFPFFSHSNDRRSRVPFSRTSDVTKRTGIGNRTIPVAQWRHTSQDPRTWRTAWSLTEVAPPLARRLSQPRTPALLLLDVRFQAQCKTLSHNLTAPRLKRLLKKEH